MVEGPLTLHDRERKNRKDPKIGFRWFLETCFLFESKMKNPAGEPPPPHEKRGISLLNSLRLLKLLFKEEKSIVSFFLILR